MGRSEGKRDTGGSEEVKVVEKGRLGSGKSIRQGSEVECGRKN